MVGSLAANFLFHKVQGRAEFKHLSYKVYINSLIRKICDLKVGICLTNRVCSAPTFADDLTLLGLHASVLSTLIRCAYDYCCKWRYKYHNEKSGIVAFGETPAMHGRMINTRKFFIGLSLIEEVKEYINLEFIKITVALLQPTLMRISQRPGKRQACYSQLDLIEGGLTL